MAAATSPVLAMRDVHKRYGDIEVLKGVSLEVPRGQVLALIGASGSGKTTLLRCINMLEEFEKGVIEVDGTAMGYRQSQGRRVRLSERVVARQRADIGMVFQTFNLFPHLTAEGNVMLGLRKVRGLSREAARERAQRWLGRVGLADKAAAYPYQLSGGQQQRVAIARAVAMEPRLLLLDEVTSALDPELVGEVLRVVHDLAASGITMVLVSHEMHFVRDTAGRVIFMDQGRIGVAGPPREVFGDAHDSSRLAAFLSRFRETGALS